MFNLLVLHLICLRMVESISSDFCQDKPLYNRHADCDKYVICYGSVISQVITCPRPLKWHHEKNICDWKEYANCIPETTTMPPKTTSIPTKQVYQLAKQHCNNLKCTHPQCRCPGTSIPGNLLSVDVPQMILLTMEDGINVLNFALYEELLDKRNNPNGCPVKATFFVSGQMNDFNLTQQLYKKGHEIGVQSLTHHAQQSYWKNTTYNELVNEIVSMKDQLRSHGIRNVVGYRSPYLQSAGDATFSVLKDYGFQYDSTLPTNDDQLWWPYTLEYQVQQENCVISPCPKNSYPGLWEIPVIPLKDTESCATYDSCYHYENSVDGVFNFLIDNFNRHYRHHKSPFPLFGHANWMLQHGTSFRKEGMMKFLDDLKDRPDVFLVSGSQAIDWMKSPISVKNLKSLDSWNC